MLQANKAINGTIINITPTDTHLHITTDKGYIQISPYSEVIVRITYNLDDYFPKSLSMGIVATPTKVAWTLNEMTDYYSLSTNALELQISKATAAITYYDSSCNLLLKEAYYDSKVLDAFPSYKTVLDDKTEVSQIQTADGIKETIVNAQKIYDQDLYHGRLSLEWQEDEALYGLGQHEEGHLNLRGHRQYVHQANKKIAMPFLISTKGYGLLLDTYSPLIFSDNSFGSYLYTEAVTSLDYYFVHGGSLDATIAGYRHLTGQATMLPKWAFGYMQSYERYETGQELKAIIREYREREIPIDSIVLDWQSWEADHWGQKTFDTSRFDKPSALIHDLHEQNVAFMISIWPNMHKCTPNHQAMLEQGLLLQRSDLYNAFNKEARDCYWQQAQEGLFTHGVDAWWTDSSEPFTPAWLSEQRVEPELNLMKFHEIARTYIPETHTNAYSIVHGQTIYEGQRSVTNDKRVCNLTRSGYTGQQRLGNILWSGDITAKWSTLKTQIAAGLNLCASGLPYWTLDIGGFFVKRSTAWYWDGDYDLGNLDPEYRHLYTRWFQFATFLPILRAHGTDTRREVWQFGDQGTPYYDALVAFINLRYKLLPYIYSLAGMVTQQHYTMLRLMAFDYPQDMNVYDLKDQFMLGNAFMVCPITDASGQRKVYLPQGQPWYHFFNGEKYEGGQTLSVTAPIHQLPIYVPAGAIIPMSPSRIQHTKALDESHLVLEVFSGKDGSFTFYQDEGDSYNYEKGDFSMIALTWDDAKASLTLSKRHNTYKTMPDIMTIDLYLDKSFKRTITYKNSAMTIYL